MSGLPPDRVGGAERQASHVARLLSSRHTVHILTRTATVPTELAGCPRCRVSRRTRVGVRGARFAADIGATLAAIARRRTEIDVILAYQTVIDGLIGVLARSLFGIPVVVMVRCDTEYQMDRFLQSRIFTPFVFRRADRLGVQSPTLGDELVRAFEQAGRRSMAGALRGKLFVVPNGIAPATPRQGDGDGLLFVGRLTRNKGVDVLIDAMRQLPNERLTIVGDGPERPALEQAARALGTVTFTGRVDHARVADYLDAAKALVLPSRQEGQPNIVMEAMARGVPVIATRVGGVPDLVADGRTGLLTEPGDVAGLAHAIGRMSADRELRARVAGDARREIGHYDWPQVMAGLEPLLLDVVSRARGATARGVPGGDV